jgi:molybdate transport system substrate-binding protein
VRARTIMGVSVVVMALLIGALLLLRWSTMPDQHAERLVLYCAAGVQAPVREAILAYEEYYAERHGRRIHIEVEYGGSGTLLSRIQVAREGDLFLAGDESFIDAGRELGVIRESIPLATMSPVIAVSRAKQGQIRSLSDLLEGNYRIAMGVPDGTAIGEATRAVLERLGEWEAFEQKVIVTKPTVNDLANDVKIGAADAAVVWDITARQYGLEHVADAALDTEKSRVMVGVLSATKQPAAALHFARFLGAPDQGLKFFEAHHFQVVSGDRWSDVPEVTLFSGGVNRRALEPVLEAFAKREGVRVNTVFQGCGALNAQMSTIRDQNTDQGFPDGYLACDVYYMTPVGEWFEEKSAVSSTRIVIVTARDNPHGIESLEDLARPGIRLIVGHPTHCTIGGLTERLFRAAGLYDRIMPNVVERQPSSGFLIAPVVSGAADASLAYFTDTLPEREKLTVIELDTDYAKAVQPYGVARSTGYPHLMKRLYAFIGRWQENYQEFGFGWELGRSLEEFEVVAPAGARSMRSDPEEQD